MANPSGADGTNTQVPTAPTLAVRLDGGNASSWRHLVAIQR